MVGQRFNELKAALLRKLSVGGAAASVAVIARQGTAAAQDIASAGNGGVATASANGGAVVVGDINSGGNAGNSISVGDTWGSVAIDGGTVSSLTSLDISANGGVAIADASGGDYNFAFVS